ncbi:MAG: rhomboid family intramembrane serine protease [Gammaproteobacteria bacterium]|nr:MAG: rhomboid family intramembrane serine protease [Gammaproteobacteria bacterium]
MSALVDPRNSHSVQRDFSRILTFVAVIWAVFVLDRFLPLEQFGLIPRTARGLVGIVAMPFLHGNVAHLIGNTVPLLVCLLLLAGSRANSAAITVMITVLGGIGLWFFGRTALHIGASGLVFGLIAFHIFAGVFEKRPQSVMISLVIGFLYATTLFRGVLPTQRGVSWDGHLFGVLAGVLTAFLVAGMLRDDRATAHASRSVRD